MYPVKRQDIENEFSNLTGIDVEQAFQRDPEKQQKIGLLTAMFNSGKMSAKDIAPVEVTFSVKNNAESATRTIYLHGGLYATSGDNGVLPNATGNFKGVESSTADCALVTATMNPKVFRNYLEHKPAFCGAILVSSDLEPQISSGSISVYELAPHLADGRKQNSTILLTTYSKSDSFNAKKAEIFDKQIPFDNESIVSMTVAPGATVTVTLRLFFYSPELAMVYRSQFGQNLQ